MMPVSLLGSPARGNLRPAPSAALPPLRSVRVLDQLRERLRLMHYSLRTEEVYAYWLKAFIRFNGFRHPADMGGPEVEAFLTYLANDRNVSPSTHRQSTASVYSRLFCLNGVPFESARNLPAQRHEAARRLGDDVFDAG